MPPDQCHPLTSADQPALHPEVPSVLPSSHALLVTFRPSPQIADQVLVIPFSEVQVQPSSTWQLKHPSPVLVLASTQASLGVIYPSPHCSAKVSGMVDVPPVQCHPFTAHVQSALHP